MAVELDLINLLKADATVAGLVGTRVVTNYLPASVSTPAIVVQGITRTGPRTLGGQIPAEEKVIQLRLVADTYAEIVSLAAAVYGTDGTKSGDIKRLVYSEIRDDFDFETNKHTRILEADVSL